MYIYIHTYIHTYQKLVHLLGCKCFTLYTTDNSFPYVHENTHCYCGFFYQILYTNQYFLNPTYFITHTQTHILLKVSF